MRWAVLLATLLILPLIYAQSADDFVAQMMAFDQNYDGRLLRAEITDARLLRLFDRADANHDGTVTAEELRSLYQTETAALPSNDGRRGGPRMGPPPMGQFRMGQLIPEPFQRELDLSAEQQAKLSSLQKEVDAKLDSILTSEQRDRMKRLGQRGPGPGFGGPFGGRPGPPPSKAQ